MIREVVLDTETTGLNPLNGDRMVEIGCVELINHIETKNNFHVYLNPLCDISEEVVKIHGLTKDFLADKPLFSDIVDDFLDFLKDSDLIIHNAPFDMSFINNELKLLGKEIIPISRAVDTLAMARRRFPGSANNLDTLCKKFNIDNSARDKHGALLDAELLAEVYLELIGGHEPSFIVNAMEKGVLLNDNDVTNKKVLEPRFFPATDEEISNHKDFISKMKNPVWGDG